MRTSSNDAHLNDQVWCFSFLSSGPDPQMGSIISIDRRIGRDGVDVEFGVMWRDPMQFEAYKSELLHWSSFYGVWLIGHESDQESENVT